MNWNRFKTATPKDYAMVLGGWLLLSYVFDYSKIPILGKLDILNDESF